MEVPLMTDMRMRLFRPHYIVNFLSGPLFSLYIYQTATEPADNVDGESTLMMVMAAISFIKFMMMQTAEERIDAVSFNLRMIALYLGYKYKAWITMGVILFSWLVTFEKLPVPGYRGYSCLEPLCSLEELDAAVKATAPPATSSTTNKGKGKGKSKDEAKDATVQPALVVMYAAQWSNASRYFETTFAKLSLKYASERLNFAVLNVDASQEATKKYRVNVNSAGLEIPTVVLYRDGKESRRLPSSGNGTAARLAWSRSFKSVVDAFELNDLAYDPEQKPNPPANLIG